MSLRNLKLPANKATGDSVKRYNDVDIGCDIVDRIFDEIALSLKSSNISLVAKGFIKSLVLTKNTQGGVKDFIRNMNDERAKKLLDDIEANIAKRRRT